MTGSPPVPSSSRLARVGARAVAVMRSRWVRVSFLAVVLAAAVYAITRDVGAVAAAAREVGGPAVAASAVAVLAGYLASAMAFRGLLAGLGSPLPVPVAFRIFLIGQLGKYLPGGVWNVVTQAELAADHAVPRTRTIAASTLTLGISIGVGGVLALPGLLVLSVPGVPPAVLAVVPCLLLVFHPAVVNRVLARLGRLVHRPLARSLSGRVLAATLGWSMLAWLALGLHLALLLASVGAPLTATTAVASVSGFTLAWLVGFLVLFAPAGAGAREIALVAVLLAVVDRPEALVVVLASRLLMTGVELLAAAMALVTGRGRRPVAVR